MLSLTYQRETAAKRTSLGTVACYKLIIGLFGQFDNRSNITYRYGERHCKHNNVKPCNQQGSHNFMLEDLKHVSQFDLPQPWPRPLRPSRANVITSSSSFTANYAPGPAVVMLDTAKQAAARAPVVNCRAKI